MGQGKLQGIVSCKRSGTYDAMATVLEGTRRFTVGDVPEILKMQVIDI